MRQPVMTSIGFTNEIAYELTGTPEHVLAVKKFIRSLTTLDGGSHHTDIAAESINYNKVTYV